MYLQINSYNKKGQKHGWWIDYYRDQEPKQLTWFINTGKPYSKELFENGRRILYKHFFYDGSLNFEKLNIY